MAQRPSVATGCSASDDQIWIMYHDLHRHDFYMPTGTEGAPRLQELIPYRVAHADPSPDDSDDEPFDLWAEDIHFQYPSERITSHTGSQWAGFPACFKNPDYIAENNGRDDAGPPLPITSEPSGQAHTAKPRPSPPVPSKEETEAHSLTHLPDRRWCFVVCVVAKGKESPRTPTSDRLPVVHMGFACMGTREHRDERDALPCDWRSGADHDGDRCAYKKCQPRRRRLDGYEAIHSRAREDTCRPSSGRSIFQQGLASEVGSLIMHVAPTASSQSQGVVGRFHQTRFAHARTMRLAVASRLVLG